MAELHLDKLADDLLSIEINTIVKTDMSATKMPSSRRQVLYEIAKDYDAKLKEFKVRDPIYWKYAGMRSFGELRDRAQWGIEELQKLPQDQQMNNERKIKMLERIRSNSSNIVDMFKTLGKNVRDNGIPDYEKVPKSPDREELIELNKLNRLVPAGPHQESKEWNNDIKRDIMNRIKDIDMTRNFILMIGKAWDIGTEQILMQTIIQLDGDITTRISNGFFEKPSSSRDIILQIHNKSINTSVELWSTIVKTVKELVQSVFKSIMGK